MTTVKLNYQWSGAIADANEGNVASSKTDWDKNSEFIVILAVGYADPCNNATDAAQIKLQYQKDGGTWTDLGTGELVAGSNTTLVNGATVSQLIAGDQSGAICNSGFVANGYEVEGTNTSNSFSNGSEEYTEVQFAVDPSGGTPGSTYTFRGYQVTEGVALTVGASPSVTIATPQSQSADITDNLEFDDSALALTGFKADQADTVNLTSQLNALGNYKRYLADTIQLAEAIITLRSISATITDTILFSDYVTSIRQLYSNLSDILNFADSTAVHKTLYAIISNALLYSTAVLFNDINATEENNITNWSQEDGLNFTQEVNLGQDATVTDTLEFADQFVTILHKLLHVIDSVELADQLTSFVGRFASVTDTVLFSDNLNTLVGYVVDIQNTLNLIAQIDSNIKRFATITDTILFSDAFASGQTAYINDMLYLSESLITLASKFIDHADTIDLIDQQDAVAHRNQLITNTINLSDTLTASANLFVVITDIINYASQLDSALHKFADISDTVTLADQTVTLQKLLVNIYDSLELYVNIRTGAFVDIFDTVELSDSMSAVITFLADIQDVLNLIEDHQSSIGYYANLVDGLQLTDQIRFVLQTIIQDTLNLSSVLTTSVTRKALIANTLEFLDNIIANMSMYVGDVLPLYDALVALYDQVNASGETMAFGDEVKLVAHYKVSLADTLLFKDIRGINPQYIHIQDTIGFLDSKYTQVIHMPCPEGIAANCGDTYLTDDTIFQKSYNPNLILYNASFAFGLGDLFSVLWDQFPASDDIVRVYWRVKDFGDPQKTVVADFNDHWVEIDAGALSSEILTVMVRRESDTEYGPWVVVHNPDV